MHDLDSLADAIAADDAAAESALPARTSTRHARKPLRSRRRACAYCAKKGLLWDVGGTTPQLIEPDGTAHKCPRKGKTLCEVFTAE